MRSFAIPPIKKIWSSQTINASCLDKLELVGYLYDAPPVADNILVVGGKMLFKVDLWQNLMASVRKLATIESRLGSLD